MNSSYENVTGAKSQCSASITDSIQVKAIKTILLSTVMVAALVGNIFIITIVYKNKTMRRTTNIFIANMAASDMLVAAVVIPRILTELYIGPWRWLIDGPLGVITCKFCFFLADFSVCISITSHVVIAIDRFWAIVYALRPSPITPARRKYIIALTWLFSFALHSPNLYIYKLRHFRGQTYCTINWYPLDNFTSKKVFYSLIFLFVFCIPVFLMIILYSRLVIALIGQSPLQTQAFQFRRQRRKEDILVLRKVVVMVVVFLGSLIPINVLALLVFYFWDGKMPCSAWNFSFPAFFLLISNSAVNPCLCISLNDSYKRHIRKIFSWKYVMNVTSPTMMSSVRSTEVENVGHCNGRVEQDVHSSFRELRSSTKMLQNLKRQPIKTLELLPVSSGAKHSDFSA